MAIFSQIFTAQGTLDVLQEYRLIKTPKYNELNSKYTNYSCEQFTPYFLLAMVLNVDISKHMLNKILTWLLYAFFSP